MLKYTGVMDIDTYTGAVTGQAYPFGLFRQRGFVDRRDVASLLSITEDTLPVFEVL